MPLFSLLVCFPLPVGNCTLSLLPSRRFPLVRICHCSSIRFRVFYLPPPPFLLLLVLRPLPRPVSLCLLSTLVVPSPSFLCSSIFHHRLSAACPRARATKRRRSRSPASAAFAPGRASNLIIRRLIIREKGTRITRVQLFSPESFRLPLYRRLNAAARLRARARILCGPYARARG